VADGRSLVLDRIEGATMTTWQLQGAAARLGELIERAHAEGPQTIARDGMAHVVVLSIENYQGLLARKPDFKAYLLSGPKAADFPIDRDSDTGRIVEP
jgi:antitoxin Phd